MTLLRRTDELILLAILHLEDNAYGVTIRRHLMTVTGEHFSFASIYGPLDRLVKIGLARAMDGPPTKERGGRRRRLFKLNAAGIEALEEMALIREALRFGSPKVLPGGAS